MYYYTSLQPIENNMQAVKPNTHRWRRNSTVELSRVGGVNAPVGSRDQWPVTYIQSSKSLVVTQFTTSCAVELLRLVTT